jgi:hypothetical protein
MECPREKDRCSGCGSRDVIRRGSQQRQVVAPPLALQTTKLMVSVPRLKCRNCGRVLQAEMPNVVAGCNDSCLRSTGGEPATDDDDQGPSMAAPEAL